MPTNYDLKYPGATIDDLLDIVNALTAATQSADGLMSSSDKIKLDGMTAGAEPNVIDGVTIDGVAQTITNKKVVIGLDTTPATNSKNLMTSGSLKVAFDKKADKDTDAVEDNIAKFDENGNPVDSGISIEAISQIAYRPKYAVGLVDIESAGTAQEFTRRQSAGGGVAFIKRIKGNSIVWNQLAQNGNFASDTDWTAIRGSKSVANNKLTFTKSEVAGAGCVYQSNCVAKEGHKVYIAATVKSSINTTINPAFYTGTDSGFNVPVSANTKTRVSGIATITTNGASGYLRFYLGALADGATVTLENVIVVDLTLMFGAGNEPSTVAEFEALYPLEYYAYNAGELRNNTAEKLVTTGFNQWDEVWEQGSIAASTGNMITDANRIRPKNHIPVLPNTTYYFFCGSWRTSNVYILFYAASGDTTPISYTALYYSSSTRTFTTPNNCNYIKFSFETAVGYGGSYRNDICINLSDASRNGAYVPYQKNELQLGITTLTGKLNGAGESVTIFPDGMKSAGSAYDEITKDKAVKRMGVVELGTLNWTYTSGEPYDWMVSDSIAAKANNSEIANFIVKLYYTHYSFNALYSTASGSNGIAINAAGKVVIRDTGYSDAAAFKAAMSGVYLYYELTTPEYYTLDEPIEQMIPVDEDGTEEVTQPTGAAEPAAPFSADVNYSIRIQKLLHIINSLNQ